MNRTVTPCLSRRLSSACLTCLVNDSEMGTFSSVYRSGTTRFLTRIRGVWPSLYRILQTVSVRQTLTRFTESVAFESCDHSRIFWSLESCRSPDSLGLAKLTWPRPARAVISTNPPIRARCRLLIPFTCPPAHGVQTFWAGLHDARRPPALWSVHSFLSPHPMLRSIAA